MSSTDSETVQAQTDGQNSSLSDFAQGAPDHSEESGDAVSGDVERCESAGSRYTDTWTDMMHGDGDGTVSGNGDGGGDVDARCCQRCGASVSSRYRRVFGDNTDRVYACRECLRDVYVNQREIIHQGGAACPERRDELLRRVSSRASAPTVD